MMLPKAPSLTTRMFSRRVSGWDSTSCVAWSFGAMNLRISAVSDRQPLAGNWCPVVRDIQTPCHPHSVQFNHVPEQRLPARGAAARIRAIQDHETPAPPEIPFAAGAVSSLSLQNVDEHCHRTVIKLQYRDHRSGLGCARAQRRDPEGGSLMKIAATAVALGLAGIAVAVGPAQAQQITGAGATFPAPVYAKWGELAKAATGIELNYQAIGSGGGQNQILKRTVDFGASDTPMDPAKLESGKLLQFPTVIGSVSSSSTSPASRSISSS